ncbi:hypothetical protein [Actinoplanes sp. NPDC051494]|uniref:hypothetical protein n=1 Tax=Actinoplanes sp. NPDC051494 TaxID=3363907 RepID=UPI003794CAD1
MSIDQNDGRGGYLWAQDREQTSPEELRGTRRRKIALVAGGVLVVAAIIGGIVHASRTT